MKKSRVKHDEAFVWVSFSDLLTTLLLSFMVIALYAIAQANELADNQKPEFQKEIETGKRCVQERREQNQGEKELKVKLLNINEGISAAFQEIKKLNSSACQNANIEINDTQDGVRLYLSQGANESTWFVDGQSSLGIEGQKCIGSFAQIWVNQIQKYDALEAVDQLIIEGHSNSLPFANAKTVEENFLKNLELSQQRALAATTYILQVKDSMAGWRQGKTSAVGRSFLSRINGNDGKEDTVKSKRLEFRIKLKTLKADASG